MSGASALSLAASDVAGMNVAALERLRLGFEGLVARGRMPGAVMMVMRRGGIACFEALGRLSPDDSAPMQRDSIFRIYSMTKPIVSVAVMRLFERGLIRLSDPVAKYLSEFAATRVGVERDGELDIAAPGRPMTIHDLLRHTSGLTYEFLPKSLVRQAYLDANIASRKRSNAEISSTLAGLPLMHSPGTVWDYSRGTDVLGRIIEVVSGQSLGEHLQEVVFGSLGMSDTGFCVPAAKHHRIAEPFATDPDTGSAVRLLDARQPAALESGGGGLMSTAPDYARFLQMLLQGGTLDDTRVLGRKTVELMTADHLGAIPSACAILPAGYGFGLGFAVRLLPGVASDPGSVGTYGWSGVAGTMFFVDPHEEMFGLMMVQAPWQADELREFFRNMVFAAID